MVGQLRLQGPTPLDPTPPFLVLAAVGTQALETATRPTTGVDMARVPLEPTREAVVKEVGACLQQRWERWLAGAQGVVVVLDLAPGAAHDANLVAALQVVEAVRQTTTPTLLVLNKV